MRLTLRCYAHCVFSARQLLTLSLNTHTQANTQATTYHAVQHAVNRIQIVRRYLGHVPRHLLHGILALLPIAVAVAPLSLLLSAQQPRVPTPGLTPHVRVWRRLGVLAPTGC